MTKLHTTNLYFRSFFTNLSPLSFIMLTVYSPGGNRWDEISVNPDPFTTEVFPE
jgi:hypothetical protein